ncbi:MAG: hypothetical protein JRJ45_06995 [Deltaproteobacteria bacterium]|nr:hypothetical protein [Deltaproteobacteria bacterium]
MTYLIKEMLGEGMEPEDVTYNYPMMRPDVTFYLSVASNITVLRRQKRSGEEELYEKEEFQEKVCVAYEHWHELYGHYANSIWVDGSRPVDAIADQCRTTVERVCT